MMRRPSIGLTLATAIGTVMFASAAAAETAVDTASAALSFWMTWGLVYLSIGGVLAAVAAAIAVREAREWSSLLRWTAAEDRTVMDDEDDGERASRRAA
jgi:hypothetical protein